MDGESEEAIGRARTATRLSWPEMGTEILVGSIQEGAFQNIETDRASDLYTMNVLLINDNSAHLNWGAQATPPALTQIIRDALPDCTIDVLSNEWLCRRYMRLKAPFPEWYLRRGRWLRLPFMTRFSSRATLYPEIADDCEFWADEWLAGRGGPPAREFLAVAEKADLIVYNGENSIYRNTPEGCRGIFLLWLAKTRLGKRSCIVNHTAHMNDVRPIMSGLARKVFPVLDLVAVREPCSFANLKALGIKNAELFPDAVFALNPGKSSRARADEWRTAHGLGDQSYFCLSTSALPVSMPRSLWDGEVTAMVRDLKETLGLQAVLVAKDPWCLPLAEVARRTDAVYFGPEHEFQDLWPLFEGASLLVTGHYHYAIFGAMVGCPFIPLSANNHKMQGLCKHLGWARSDPFDITSLRTCRGEIVEEAGRLLHDRSELSAELIEKVDLLRKDTDRLGEKIAHALYAGGKQ